MGGGQGYPGTFHRGTNSLVGVQFTKRLLAPRGDTPQSLLNKTNGKYFLQNPYLFDPLRTLY
jgi:hypothetical protein